MTTSSSCLKVNSFARSTGCYGWSIRPLIADVFITHVANLAEDLVVNMSVYKRYEDDSLVICERKDEMNCLLSRLITLRNHISL